MADETDQIQSPSQNTKPRTRYYSSYGDFFNDIPEEGSLGILAMGFQGVLAWRRKKEALKAEREKSTPSGKTEHRDG